MNRYQIGKIYKITQYLTYLHTRCRRVFLGADFLGEDFLRTVFLGEGAGADLPYVFLASLMTAHNPSPFL